MKFFPLIFTSVAAILGANGVVADNLRSGSTATDASVSSASILMGFEIPSTEAISGLQELEDTKNAFLAALSEVQGVKNVNADSLTVEQVEVRQDSLVALSGDSSDKLNADGQVYSHLYQMVMSDSDIDVTADMDAVAARMCEVLSQSADELVQTAQNCLVLASPVGDHATAVDVTDVSLFTTAFAEQLEKKNKKHKKKKKHADAGDNIASKGMVLRVMGLPDDEPLAMDNDVLMEAFNTAFDIVHADDDMEIYEEEVVRIEEHDQEARSLMMAAYTPSTTLGKVPYRIKYPRNYFWYVGLRSIACNMCGFRGRRLSEVDSFDATLEKKNNDKPTFADVLYRRVDNLEDIVCALLVNSGDEYFAGAHECSISFPESVDGN